MINEQLRIKNDLWSQVRNALSSSVTSLHPLDSSLRSELWMSDNSMTKITFNV